jgi:hypothetical protein
MLPPSSEFGGKQPLALPPHGVSTGYQAASFPLPWLVDSSALFHSKPFPSTFADCLKNQITPRDLCGGRWMFESKLCLKPWSTNPWKCKTFWRTKTNKLSQITKGLRNWWHSKRVPQVSSKKVTGSSFTPIQPLLSVVTVCLVLEAKVIILPKPGKEPKFPQNLGPIWKRYHKNSQTACWRE